jgi:hypothetical protein
LNIVWQHSGIAVSVADCNLYHCLTLEIPEYSSDFERFWQTTPVQLFIGLPASPEMLKELAYAAYQQGLEDADAGDDWDY